MNYEPKSLPRLRSLHKSLVQRCSVSSVFVGAQARSPTPKPHTVSEMRGLRLTSTSCGISLEKTTRRSGLGLTSTRGSEVGGPGWKMRSAPGENTLKLFANRRRVAADARLRSGQQMVRAPIFSKRHDQRLPREMQMGES